MVHIELDKLNEKENEEILSIEQKYKKLRQHYFSKRSEVIETIPDFWSTVFTSHPAICHILYEDEEDCLRHLQKLEVDTAENIKSGYSIKLYFNENSYFKNDLLVKEFFYKQGNLSSVSTKIDWKKPHPSVPVREGSSKSGRKRSHTTQQTFFGWFANNENASSDIIAEIIKDDIWLNSLHYYLVPDPDMEGNNDKEDDSTDSSSTDFEEEEMYEANADKRSLQSNYFQIVSLSYFISDFLGSIGEGTSSK
ncbi:NAP domain containing protein [Asbolus verrucosus]|uniref:NAP domain containing protein n=1 Tax=Asbolus verrucosus TaxID=1661398 RepID=A0A482V2H1_ASBVE|nr:NAP domain containing protein [Asbolus verrucosus]